LKKLNRDTKLYIAYSVRIWITKRGREIYSLHFKNGMTANGIIQQHTEEEEEEDVEGVGARKSPSEIERDNKIHKKLDAYSTIPICIRNNGDTAFVYWN